MTAQDHSADRKTALTAVLLTCVAYAFFNISDAALKLMALKFHFSQIMSLNSCFVLLFLSVYGAITEGKKAFRTGKPGMMTVRALLAQGVAVCNISALPHVPLTTFYTLVFTSPLCVALLSAFFLRDKLDARRLGVILAGFAVVLFVFRPGGGLLDIYTGFVLTGALLYSCQLVIMRGIGRGESRCFMFMYGSVISILLMAPLLPAHYVAPTAYEWGMFAMMGVVGAIGLLCISYAFQTAPSASVVAPYHYTQIVWATGLGWFIFHETPDAHVMTGAALIIAAGMYLIFHETRRGRRMAVPVAETAV